MLSNAWGKLYQAYLLDTLLKAPFFQRISPLSLSLISCLIGIATFPLLGLGFVKTAFLCLMLSGFLDTLDGSVARMQKTDSSKGAVLDIFCDRVVEICVILGLFAIDPTRRSWEALAMLSSVLLCITSFLVVGIFSQNTTEKSFYYSPGLIERFEAFLFFSLMMFLPGIFSYLAYAFSGLVLMTALIRMAQFLRKV